MIDQFLGTQERRERGYEEGELVLYKATILEQVGIEIDRYMYTGGMIFRKYICYEASGLCDNLGAGLVLYKATILEQLCIEIDR